MTNEEQAKTKDPEELLREYDCEVYDGNVYFQLKYAVNAMNEYSKGKQAEIDRLQAKITELSGILLDCEEKFDLIAENEAKRVIEFGEAVKGKCLLEAWGLETPNITRENIESIDIKQLYTNFKKP